MESDSKNILMELESLKSQQCIFKRKEANYIKDKEILEDSIKTLQQDLQEKSEIIRSLRKDLDAQSSNLYRDIATKNEELDKSVLEVNDLSKKLTIALETIEYHVKRNETIRVEFDKQKKSYDRESECKSQLVTFLETSNSQKESKISSLSSEVNSLKLTLADVERQFENQKSLNDDFKNNIEILKDNFSEERQKRDQDLQRAKNEILQLQQNGISELHLEKMNPILASTIKSIKSSKGLMDLYSELHGVIGERDHLQLEKARLLKANGELNTVLQKRQLEIERLTNESTESMKVTDNLKSRLLFLVNELRGSEAKKAKMERDVLLVKRKAELSEKEVTRLMQQVRVLLIDAGNVESIKQEPVDVDSAMYTSVQELQEVNRALRNDNDGLRQRLEESESEQYKQRCNELQVYSDRLSSEVNQLRHETTTNKNLLLIHEKQVQMLRYLLDLKNPSSTASIEKALRSFEISIKGNVDVVTRECESTEDEQLMDCELEINDQSNRITKLENDILEMFDNKKASDQIYIQSIERLRTDFGNQSRLASELQGKLEDLKERFNEERECNEKYRNESELLRSLNKNLSNNTAILEAQLEEIKLKMECKITQLAEKKAELDNCKSQLALCRSQQTRLRHERDELKRTLDGQKEILSNITSLQSISHLKDHLSLSNMQHKVNELESLVDQLNMQLNSKNDEIIKINDELNDSKAELNESMSQLHESKALADAFNEGSKAPETCDSECQVELLTVNEPGNEELHMAVECEPIALVDVTEYQKTITNLEEQLKDVKILQQSSSDQLVIYAQEITELKQKSEFYESQLNILEKAKQEVLNENIKLTEEAHDLNASLKQELHRQQEEFVKMKIRLDEAENVERTAQSVIDKYVKECNEAKAKYKRELTLHAADSKLLETLNKEIEILKSREDNGDERCKQLREDFAACEEKWMSQLETMRTQVASLEKQLGDAESRNERLHQQLIEGSINDSNAVLNEVIEDLRSQIHFSKLSENLLTVEKEKYTNELDRLNSSIRDLQDQLSMEKDKLNMSLSDSDMSSKNIETEIVMESNQVLREQKSQLDRLVLSQKTQIEELNEKMCRLQNNVAELNGNNNNLVALKSELEEERNRWKERCTKLIERAEQLDPEKYRIACLDRDRFEKQLYERENSLKDVQNELNDSKVEIQRLLSSIEEETNKFKKEEAIGLQLKEIARKYKSESEKRRQTIVELEDSISELNDEKSKLLKEKETVLFDIAGVQLQLSSKTEMLNDENEKLTSKLETLELDFESQTQVLMEEKQELSNQIAKLESELAKGIEELTKEKENINDKLMSVQLELDSRSKLTDELECRCQLLEQVSKEKSMKLQLIESTIVRLKEDNIKLKMSCEEKVMLKRVFDDDFDVDEPESKKIKVTLDELYVENNEEEEDDDEEEFTAMNDIETVASNMIQNDVNIESGTKIWWNVSATGDGDILNQIHQNLDRYTSEQTETVRNVEDDKKEEGECESPNINVDNEDAEERQESEQNERGRNDNEEEVYNEYGNEAEQEDEEEQVEGGEYDRGSNRDDQEMDQNDQEMDRDEQEMDRGDREMDRDDREIDRDDREIDRDDREMDRDDQEMDRDDQEMDRDDQEMDRDDRGSDRDDQEDEGGVDREDEVSYEYECRVDEGDMYGGEALFDVEHQDYSLDRVIAEFIQELEPSDEVGDDEYDEEDGEEEEEEREGSSYEQHGYQHDDPCHYENRDDAHYSQSMQNADRNRKQSDSDSSVMIIEDSSDETEEKESTVTESVADRDNEEHDDCKSETISSMTTRADDHDHESPVIVASEVARSPPRAAFCSNNATSVNTIQAPGATSNQVIATIARQTRPRKLNRRGN